MMSYNPTIPSSHSIPGGYLRPGEGVVIQGHTLHSSSRFSVNLIEGSNTQYVFHFDFRFDENTTVRNCNYQSPWGHEERSALPIQKGQFFYMEIRAADDRYLVAVSGKLHSEFQYRAPPSAADALNIQGDVHITSVEFKSQPTRSGFCKHRLHAVKPTLPFVSSITGDEIQVHGRVMPNANRFSVNLQQGTRIDGSQVIALHVNPRFEGGHPVVVLNSKTDGWADEKRVDGSANPFRTNGRFLLTLRRQADHFEIFVNGVHFQNFEHRMSADVVDTVYIEGDVIANHVLAF